MKCSPCLPLRCSFVSPYAALRIVGSPNHYHTSLTAPAEGFNRRQSGLR